MNQDYYFKPTHPLKQDSLSFKRRLMYFHVSALLQNTLAFWF